MDRSPPGSNPSGSRPGGATAVRTLTFQWRRRCSRSCPACYLARRPSAGRRLRPEVIGGILDAVPAARVVWLLNPGSDARDVRVLRGQLAQARGGGRRTVVQTTASVVRRFRLHESAEVDRAVVSVDAQKYASPRDCLRRVGDLPGVDFCVTLLDELTASWVEAGFLRRLADVGLVHVHLGRPSPGLSRERALALLSTALPHDLLFRRVHLDCELMLRLGLSSACPGNPEVDVDDASLRFCPYEPRPAARISSSQEVVRQVARLWSRPQSRCPWVDIGAEQSCVSGLCVPSRQGEPDAGREHQPVVQEGGRP